MWVDRTSPENVQHFIVMGVAGSGKTSVATLLAERLGVTFAEGDAFHPPANVAKMSAGTPLTDEDRWPWLESIRDWLTARTREGVPTVVPCSALRRAYRDILRGAEGRVRFVHLTGTPELLTERIGRRSDHFMRPAMLTSQLATLEPLGADEDGLAVDVEPSPGEIVDEIVAQLR